MNNLFLYLIQSSFTFSLLYIVYKLIYSRTTFYQLNRILLLIIPIVALIAPLSYLVISTPSTAIVHIPEFNDFVNNSEQIITSTIKDTAIVSYNFNRILSYFYLLGCIVMLIKIIYSIGLIFGLKKQSKYEVKGNFKLVFTNELNTFSFFNWIFISKEINTTDTSLIIEHEKAHSLLKHTIDVLFSEIYILFFWFNPFVYSYRKSLKSIHEYQADAWVIRKNIKKSMYLYALLENIQRPPSNNLYSYFNQSVIKKRIDMITKKPTKKMYKLSYTLLIICSSVLCFAFTKSNEVKELVPYLSVNSTNIFNPPFLFPVKNKSREDITSVYGKKGRFSKKTKKKIHQGIDIRAEIGTPVIATADGFIMKASNENSWGNLIVLNHADGYQTWYAHLDDFNVKEKQTVNKGEVIGYVGNTGLSSGPHLHYEVRLNDKHLDPLDVIEE